MKQKINVEIEIDTDGKYCGYCKQFKLYDKGCCGLFGKQKFDGKYLRCPECLEKTSQTEFEIK